MIDNKFCEYREIGDIYNILCTSQDCIKNEHGFLRNLKYESICVQFLRSKQAQIIDEETTTIHE